MSASGGKRLCIRRAARADLPSACVARCVASAPPVKPRFVYFMTGTTGIDSTGGRHYDGPPDVTVEVHSTMRSANRAAHDFFSDLRDYYGGEGEDDEEEEDGDSDGDGGGRRKPKDDGYEPSATEPFSREVQTGKYDHATVEVVRLQLLGPDLGADEVAGGDGAQAQEPGHKGERLDTVHGAGRGVSIAEEIVPPLKRAREA